MGKKYDGLKNFYQMKLREHREEIDELNGAIKKITDVSQRMFGAEWEEAPPTKFVYEDDLETVESSVTEDND